MDLSRFDCTNRLPEPVVRQEWMEASCALGAVSLVDLDSRERGGKESGDEEKKNFQKIRNG